MKKLCILAAAACALAVNSISASAATNECTITNSCTPDFPTSWSCSLPACTEPNEFIKSRVDSILERAEKRIAEIKSRANSSSIIINRDEEGRIHIEIYNDFADESNDSSDYETTESDTYTEAETESSSDFSTETQSQDVNDEDLSIESEVLSLHNKIREENGLKPLTEDKNLSLAAVSHAKDMYKNNYFSHDSIDGRSFSERVGSYVSGYTTMGENIAQGAMSAEEVMALWMDSPGHKDNILDESYTHIGIGVYNGYFVVDFAG